MLPSGENAAERAALAAAGFSGFPTSGENAGNTPFPKWRCIANALLRDEPGEKCNGLINRSNTAQTHQGLSVQLNGRTRQGGLSHQWVAAAAMRVLTAQGSGGFLLFNASKAAFNPGEGFGPYAIAKAGLVALMKQYALEGAKVGVRANAVNADRVRTGLFPPAVVEARAAARGLEPEAYFRANLLGREVTAEDVAEAFLSLALARSTTGAVLPVDGGNLAAAPR